MMKGLMMMEPSAVALVFGDQERTRLHAMLDIDTECVQTSFDEVTAEDLAHTEVLVTGWGTPRIGAAEIARMPRLRAIVHWGGGVGFVDPDVLDRGILVSSARAANAVPVAEFTLAMIVLAAKEALWVSRAYSAQQRPVDRESELAHAGLYGTTIGVVGASAVGAKTMELLASFDVEILLYDPWVTREGARRWGAELVGDVVTLAERSTILTVHAPDVPATRGMISREVLAALPDDATLINTSRGALVDQESLVDELVSGRIRAILDVTSPEVLPAGHPLYHLPNVFLTPHLAGSMGNELRRLGQMAVSEIERLVDGRPLAHPAAP